MYAILETHKYFVYVIFHVVKTFFWLKFFLVLPISWTQNLSLFLFLFRNISSSSLLLNVDFVLYVFSHLHIHICCNGDEWWAQHWGGSIKNECILRKDTLVPYIIQSTDEWWRTCWTHWYSLMFWAYILHLRTFIDKWRKCPFVFRIWPTAWCDITWASGKLGKKKGALLYFKTFSVFLYVPFLPGFVCVVKWVLIYPDRDIFTEKCEITNSMHFLDCVNLYSQHIWQACISLLWWNYVEIGGKILNWLVASHMPIFMKMCSTWNLLYCRELYWWLFQ